MMNTILFDLDGTLIDTSPGIVKANQIAIKEHGFECPPVEILKKFIGPPLTYSYKKYLGTDDNKAEELVKTFRSHYEEKLILESDLYPGIEDVLSYLKEKDYKLGVATYKPENSANYILDYLGIKDYFDIILGSNPSGSIGKAMIIGKCINYLGTSKSDSVLIGDSQFDLDAAKEAGIPLIAVMYGFGFKNKSELNDSTIVGVANTPEEILNLI